MATLLGWFGASDGQLDTVLPNLKNFGSVRKLVFLWVAAARVAERTGSAPTIGLKHAVRRPKK